MAEPKNKKFRTPAQPTFDVMQQVSIPDYKVKRGYGLSQVMLTQPDTVILDPINDLTGKPRTPFELELLKAHEIQHQIEGKAKQKGQTPYLGAVYPAWRENARQLGYDAQAAENVLKNLLSKPEVQEYFTQLGADPRSRILNPKASPLDEILADLSAWQTVTKQPLETNPVLAKYVFTDPKLAELVKSTTGMAGVVLGDSDYTPYSREAAQAWGYKQPPSMFQKTKDYITNVFYKDPFSDTTK